MNLEELLAAIKGETGQDLTGEDYLAQNTDSLEYLQVVMVIEEKLGRKLPEDAHKRQIKDLLTDAQT